MRRANQRQQIHIGPVRRGATPLHFRLWCKRFDPIGYAGG
jgi:hypothetical protein